MYKYPIRRNYTTGWYSLSRNDAINGLVASLSERKGVQNLSILSCTPAQFGDKGYNIHVSYEEDLDMTFEFPEGLESVIFVDVDSFLLPYNVRCIASLTNAGIVITTPSIKDEFYDEGIMLPQRLSQLMEHARENGTQIVGITPSTKDISPFANKSLNKIEYSIINYLRDHPSIKRFIIVSNEDMKDLSPYLFKGEDISWSDEEKVKDILSGKVKVKELRQERSWY